MENISVNIRIRPIKLETENTYSWKLEGNNIVNTKTKDIFSYDRVFSNDSKNIDIFKECVKENLNKFLTGVNVCIFAYGQTCTGKTFTMRGSDEYPGIIPQSLNYIFMKIRETDDNGYFSINDSILKISEIKVSYLEIYNESVNDLLDTSKKNLEIREEKKKGIYVENLTEIRVDTPDIAFNLLKQGDSNKIIAETKLNEKSSRSHCIFKVSIETTDNSGKKYMSILNLVDLAGSENAAKTKSEGVRLQEGSNINKSLLALSSVIQKISHMQQYKGTIHVSYRDSKLTRYLQPSLSGNSKTIVICTIAAGTSNYSESLNTLLFAARAKNIKLNIKVNEIIEEKDKVLIENNELKNRIKKLEEKILTTNKKNLCMSSSKFNTNNLNSIYSSAKCNNLLNTYAPQNKMITEFNLETKEENIIKDIENELTVLKGMILKNPNTGCNNGNKNDDGRFKTTKKQLFNEDNDKENNNNLNYLKLNENSNYIMNTSTPSKDAFPKPSQLYTQQWNSSAQNNYTNFNAFQNLSNNKNVFASPYLQKSSNYQELTTNTKSFSNPFNQNLFSQSKFQFNDMSEDVLEVQKQNRELKQYFMEALDKKNKQIKSLNENNDKIRRDLEENYLKIKLENQRLKEELNIKELDLREILNKLNSSEKQGIYLKDEIKKLKESLEKNSNDSKKTEKNEETNLSKLIQLQNEKNQLLTMNNEMIDEMEIIKDKLERLSKMNENLTSENLSLKTQTEIINRKNESLKVENFQLKSNIESYKSELGLINNKILQKKQEINQMKLEQEKIVKKNYLLEYENRIKELQNEKNKLEKELNRNKEESKSVIEKLIEKEKEKESILENHLPWNKIILACSEIREDFITTKGSIINTGDFNTIHINNKQNGIENILSNWSSKSKDDISSFDPLDVKGFSLENKEIKHKENCKLLDSNYIEEMLNKKRGRKKKEVCGCCY
jgi:centromeric protein E